MDHFDTHDIEVAFDELMKELSKLKDLNDLVNAYKDNIDTLSSKVKCLAEQIESFYKTANEHDNQVNLLYKGFVEKAEYISEELEKRNQEFKQIVRRNMVFNVLTLILGLLTCAGLVFLIFFA